MARKTLPLSDLQWRSAKPRERDYKLFDGDGLFLLVKANGTKSWRFRYTKPTGREGLTAFGNYPALTLAQARKRRDEARALLLQGRDPVEQKLVARQEAELARKTFQAVALEWHAEMATKWSPHHAATVLSRLKAYLFPVIGHRHIAELDTCDLLIPLEKAKKRGTVEVASRLQQYMGSIMRDAKRAQLIGQNPAHDLVGAVTLKKTVHRPALPLNRLPELLDRIEAYRGRELTRLAVELSLHVFVRSSELRFARWSEFDLDRALWEIPDTRKAIKGVRFSTRGTKMPGDHDSWKPLSENTINKALRSMGYDTKTELCGHGFRTMACSALIESGLWSEDAIERQMSHKERNHVRAAYIHKAEFLEQRRLIMDWWNRYLEANRQGHVSPYDFANAKSKKVVRLRRGCR